MDTWARGKRKIDRLVFVAIDLRGCLSSNFRFPSLSKGSQSSLSKCLRTCESGKRSERSTCVTERHSNKWSRINARRKKERKIWLKSGYKQRHLELSLRELVQHHLNRGFLAEGHGYALLLREAENRVSKSNRFSFLANLLFNNREKRRILLDVKREWRSEGIQEREKWLEMIC